MGEFIDGACLFRSRSGTLTLVQYDPSDFPFWEHHELLAISCFPPHPLAFFVFTLSHHTCYCYNFLRGRDEYSIVTITSQPLPHLYWTFFQAVIEDFNNSPRTVTPECRFTLIVTLLRSWRFTTEDEIFVQSSSETSYITVDRRLTCFCNFNPFSVIDCQVDPIDLWHIVATGRRVRVVGQSPKLVAYAAFGLASLTCPFPYRNGILLATSEHDPRLRDGSYEGAAIVGYAVEHRPPDDCIFAATIWVSSTPRFDAEVMGQKLTARFNQFSKLMDFIFGVQLFQDPYAGILLTSITDYRTMRQVPTHEMNGWITVGDLRMFEQTLTAKHWRTATKINNHMRSFFLSTRPNNLIQSKSCEQLIVCGRFVDQLIPQCRNDRHYQAVLKRHRHLIKKRLHQLSGGKEVCKFAERHTINPLKPFE
jgi:hypothetical protein